MLKMSPWNMHKATSISVPRLFELLAVLLACCFPSESSLESTTRGLINSSNPQPLDIVVDIVRRITSLVWLNSTGREDHHWATQGTCAAAAAANKQSPLRLWRARNMILYICFCINMLIDIPDSTQKHTDRENAISKKHSTSGAAAAP